MHAAVLPERTWACASCHPTAAGPTVQQTNHQAAVGDVVNTVVDTVIDSVVNNAVDSLGHRSSGAAGKLGTRALLTLTAVAGAVLNSPNERTKEQYMSWLWNLLLSSTGKALVQLDSSDVEDAEELCLAEVPACPILLSGTDTHVSRTWSHHLAAILVLPHDAAEQLAFLHMQHMLTSTIREFATSNTLHCTGQDSRAQHILFIHWHSHDGKQPGCRHLTEVMQCGQCGAGCKCSWRWGLWSTGPGQLTHHRSDQCLHKGYTAAALSA